MGYKRLRLSAKTAADNIQYEIKAITPSRICLFAPLCSCLALSIDVMSCIAVLRACLLQTPNASMPPCVQNVRHILVSVAPVFQRVHLVWARQVLAVSSTAGQNPPMMDAATGVCVPNGLAF